MLEEAAILFDRASEESMARSSQLARDFSDLMLLGREMEEMRWFLVPYEAHLYLTGPRPPAVSIPFQPRDYKNDSWYTRHYLDDWDMHWNPTYWEAVKNERGLINREPPVISRRLTMTIYPANQSHTQKIQLQPIRQEQARHSGDLSVRRKKAFASLECLYLSQEEECERSGVGEHPASPLSSGYSSEGEAPAETELQERKRRKKKRSTRSGGRVDITAGEDTRQGKKCTIM